MDGGEGGKQFEREENSVTVIVIFVPRPDSAIKKRGAVGYPMLNKLLMTMFEI
jgi:hypothetical protein